MKNGVNTTEFWLSVFATVGSAAIAIAVSYGLLNGEQAAAWSGLLAALAPLLAVVVVGWIAKGYADNRTALKMQEVEVEALQQTAVLEGMNNPDSRSWMPPYPPTEVSVTNHADGQTWTWVFKDGQ